MNLSSFGHQLEEMNLHDYNFSNGKTYNPWKAYGQSKTANILFTVSLRERLSSKGISAFAVHPGGIAETNLGTHVDSSKWGEVSELFTGRGMYYLAQYYVILIKSGFPDPMESPLKSIAAGTSSTLYAALDPSLEGQYNYLILDAFITNTRKGKSGSFIADATVAETPDYAHDPEIAEGLWTLSEKLVGEKF